MDKRRKAEHEVIRLYGEKIEYTPELIQEYINCANDIIYFAEKYYYIITLDKGRQLIKLRGFQKKILKAMTETPDGKRHLCILSSRQSGKTTTNNIFLLHYSLFNEHKKISILANKEVTAIGILKNVKIAYEGLPRFLQQGIVQGGWNKKTIEFENGTVLTAGSTSSTAGRSTSANLLILDEFAFVPDNIANYFMSSVYPLISSSETAKIIMISTPNGINLYHDFYQNACLPKDDPRANNFYPISVSWREVEGRDDKWKDSVIRDIGMMRWLQEFDCQFLGSTATLVDGQMIGKLISKEPIDVKENGSLLVYERPEKGATYLIGGDPCKGLGQDFGTMQILRIYGLEQLEQVAVYRNNKIDPHRFAIKLIEISKMYNNAALLIENNGKEGGMVIEAIHHTYQYDRLINISEEDLGITSNVKIKFIANLNMRRYMENKWIIIHDKTTIDELGKYEEVKSNIFKAKNKDDHDDTVTALIWALYFVNMIPLLGIEFDPVTKLVISGKYADSKYDNDDIPFHIIQDASEFNDEFIDEQGVIWR